ncbi:MAG: hypothetical protein E7Z96_01790 [Actinomycetaceae bacterium]|nr:hypothetical protein [Actinomycetaceae bacterium]
MALPKLTDEQRAVALEQATAARQRRAEVKRNVKAGKMTIPEVIELSASEPVLGKIRVSALIASLPGVGTAKAKQVMDELSISESRRVAGLGRHQREALIKRFS